MATRTFVPVFAGATVGDPVRLLSRVDEVMARLAGVHVDGGLETLCVSQDARVAAARSVDGEHGRSVVSLLERGELVLGSPNPLRTVRELLDGIERR